MRGRILDAIGRIVVRDGLAAVGINVLAREAGCDKVLIYRYFGDLEGVYKAFASRSDFWWTVADLTDGISPETHSTADAIKLLLRRSAAAVRARPVTLAVLAAEPVERTPLVVALESLREKRALELARWFGERFVLPQRVDVAAITLLLGVGLNYLAVRARKIRVMSGVAIKTEKDWERIFDAVDALVDGALAS
jgi:AcrR family transcriptional regulator